MTYQTKAFVVLLFFPFLSFEPGPIGGSQLAKPQALLKSFPWGLEVSSQLARRCLRPLWWGIVKDGVFRPKTS